MTRTITYLSLLSAFVITLIATNPAHAIFMQPPNIPAERITQNITAYLKENPKDAQAHYLLARVHYMQFINRVDHVRANDEGTEKKLPRLTDPRVYGKAKGDPISEEQAIEHARAAINLFKQAIKLDKDNALFHLGQAGLYEQASGLAKKIEPNPSVPPPPPGMKARKFEPESERFIRQAAEANLQAYKLDRDAALKKDSVFLPFYPIAYEAAKAYIALVDAHQLKHDKKLVQQMRDDMASIDSKPKAITPIIFRVAGVAPTSMDELIAKDRTVRFDLDADGTAERRPWVNPDTAILVWDPANTGKITSGQQLFGNMTFFMLFSDGYRALDSLDDNRDGQLAGSELKGLALWHDRNTNGVSDPGEVTPIAKTTIRSIATGTTGKINGLHPMNTAGLTLKDGSTRPTWDWVIPAAK